MRRRRQRMLFVSLAVAGVGLASWLVIGALQSNIAYFFSPSQIHAGEASVSPTKSASSDLRMPCVPWAPPPLGIGRPPGAGRG